MKQILTTILLCIALSATAQTKDSSKAARLMYYYANAHEATAKSIDSVHDVIMNVKDHASLNLKTIELYLQLNEQLINYSDSVKKYVDIRLKELDSLLIKFIKHH